MIHDLRTEQISNCIITGFASCLDDSGYQLDTRRLKIETFWQLASKSGVFQIVRCIGFQDEEESRQCNERRVVGVGDDGVSAFSQSRKCPE